MVLPRPAETVPDGRCPCGTGRRYAVCCGPFVQDGIPAPTALELMRSRYTAYALHQADHLFRTWHPQTRPTDVAPDPSVTWVDLRILDVVDGGPEDQEGIVEFIARWRSSSQEGITHERSRFTRRAKRWVYVDGTLS